MSVLLGPVGDAGDATEVVATEADDFDRVDFEAAGGAVVVVEDGEGVGARREQRGEGAEGAGGSVFTDEFFVGDGGPIKGKGDGQALDGTDGADGGAGEDDFVAAGLVGGEGVGDFAAAVPCGKSAVGVGGPAAGGGGVLMGSGLVGDGGGLDVVGDEGIGAVVEDFVIVC